ncbi:hypothetical protein C3L33_22095, partial [Rhododendron williamsianum]
MHSFAWALGESGLSLEDVVILTRLFLRGVTLLDPNNLSLADQQDIAELRRLGKLAQSGPRFTTQGVLVLRVPRDFVVSPHYVERLYMAGFFAFFLSYFVLPGYLADSPSPAVFLLALFLARGECVALAPLFLGPLHCQLDLVHADLARSLERCDHLSMVHTSFLLAYFFEHFPIVAPPPRNFAATMSPAGGNNPIAWGVINSALIALLGWLPFLNNEAHGVSAYRPDRFARQLSFDQGVPVHAPLVSSFVESQLRFTRPNTFDILARLGDLPIPSRDDVRRYTPEFRLFWRRNLDSFLLLFVGRLRFQRCPRSMPPLSSSAGASSHASSRREACSRAGCSRKDTSPSPSGAIMTIFLKGARGGGGLSSQAALHGILLSDSSLFNKELFVVLCFVALILLTTLENVVSFFQQRELDASTFVAFDPAAAAAASATERVAMEEVEEDAPGTPIKRRCLDVAVESEDEEEEDMGVGGRDDVVADIDDYNNDEDNVPRSIRFEAMQAQPSMPVGDIVAGDVAGAREVELLQPPVEPAPYLQPEPETSVVVGGTLPDEPSIVDLGGDPNTVSTELSSSSEESENVIIYSADRDPSPSHAATSKAHEPPPPMGSCESVGQADIAAEPISAAAAQLLREGEEDNVDEPPLLSARGPPAGHHQAASSSTPLGSHQQSTSARILSTESFLGRVAVGSPGVSNAFFLQDDWSTAGRDTTLDAISPHSQACSTSQAHSPRLSARHTPTPPAQPSLTVEDRQLEVNEELLGGPTSITDSDLNSLFKDMAFLPTDNVLGGQGSQALGDFGVYLNAEIGEQQREEVESREQPSPRRSPVANLGKGPMVAKMEVPIRLFPADYPVDEAYHPLLNAIARAHPETFAHFNLRSARLGALFLGNLHEVLTPWAQLRFSEFTAATETALQEVAQDMASLSAQLESARQHLANLEARLDQVTQYDMELAVVTLNLEDLDPEELVFAEWLA